MPKDQALTVDSIDGPVIQGADPTKMEAIGLMKRYGLTYKQAEYVKATILHPELTDSARVRMAGYTEAARTGDGGKVIRGDKIVKALTDERAEIERRAHALDRAIQSDARGAIRKELSVHAQDDTIAPNRTRALELLGKMEGVFIERLELDAGEHTRARFADEIVGTLAKVSVDEESSVA